MAMKDRSSRSRRPCPIFADFSSFTSVIHHRAELLRSLAAEPEDALCIASADSSNTPLITKIAL
jgi:hypothetical protein